MKTTVLNKGKTRMMHSDKIWVGVDPDVDVNGVAIWEKGELTLTGLRFFELYSMLSVLEASLSSGKVCVVIEGGWLNTKSNWHNEYQGVSAASSVGRKTGANHQTGKLIVEMCEHIGLKYEVVRPTSSKIKSDAFKKITKFQGRTNQDQRDAAMLVFGR